MSTTQQHATEMRAMKVFRLYVIADAYAALFQADDCNDHVLEKGAVVAVEYHGHVDRPQLASGQSHKYV